MKCNQCGSQVDGDFCPNCGTAIEQKTQESANEQSKVGSQNKMVNAVTKSKKPFYKKWWFWVIVVIVAIAIFAGLGDSVDDDNDSEEEMSIASSAPSETKKEDDEQISSTDTDEEQVSSDNSEQNATVSVAENASNDYIENFVSKYNNVSETPITDRVEFDPKDRESGYYRTEYRLTAWDGSIGEAATIGTVKIEMVNYGSYGNLYDNDRFRVYVTADSVEDILEIFPVMAEVMDPTVTDAEIQETIDHVKEYGDKNGLTIGNLSGYIFRTEMMLE